MESGYGRPRPSHTAALTDVGPGTPAGELLRRYWQPVGLSLELGDRPTPARGLGEDLVLFRDGRGRPGLLDAPSRDAAAGPAQRQAVGRG